jgi:hypothetical protein
VTLPSPAEQGPNAVVLGPSYQGLMARYVSNFGTQWQVFALGLAAQGFIVGAASQVTDRAITAILLSLVILFIGLATIISGVQIGRYTSNDRRVLDQYEEILLTGEFESLRLHHCARYRQRTEATPQASRDSYRARVVRTFGPFLWWVVLESVISVAGGAIPLLGIFGI